MCEPPALVGRSSMPIKATSVDADSDQMDAGEPEIASSDEISTLTARIRELEVQYAAEIERRHRAEQALANTQFELVDARRKATETERQTSDAADEIIAATPVAEVRGEPRGDTLDPRTPTTREAPVDVSPEIVSMLVSRFSRLREALEADGSAGSFTDGTLDRIDRDPDPTDAHTGVDDSLRSRLSSAANARSRVGLAEHRDRTTTPSS